MKCGKCKKEIDNDSTLIFARLTRNIHKCPECFGLTIIGWDIPKEIIDNYSKLMVVVHIVAEEDRWELTDQNLVNRRLLAAENRLQKLEGKTLFSF